MLKNILTATVFTAGLSLSGLGDAHADSRWNDDNQEYQWSDQRDHGEDRYYRHARVETSRQKIVERKIQRTLVDGMLPIRRLLDLDNSYKGYQVKSVSVKIRPKRSYGRIKLLVNGDVTDRERIDGDRWITLRTDDVKTIGRGLQSLKLAVRGQVYIKKIKVTLDKFPRARRHSEAKPHRVPTPAPVVYTRHDKDPLARILRIILKDINNKGGIL